MREVNINIEGYNVNGICVGCLNYNRKMFYCDEVKKCFKTLGNIDVPDGLTIQVCWECLAYVKKVNSFQAKILQSYNVLIDYSKQHTFLNSPDDFAKHASKSLIITQPQVVFYEQLSKIPEVDISEDKDTSKQWLEIDCTVVKAETEDDDVKLECEMVQEPFKNESLDEDNFLTEVLPYQEANDTSDEDIQLSKLKKKKGKKNKKQKKNRNKAKLEVQTTKSAETKSDEDPQNKNESDDAINEITESTGVLEAGENFQNKNESNVTFVHEKTELSSKSEIQWEPQSSSDANTYIKQITGSTGVIRVHWESRNMNDSNNPGTQQTPEPTGVIQVNWEPRNQDKLNEAYVLLRTRENARKRKYLNNLTPEQRELKKAKDREYYHRKKPCRHIDNMNEIQKQRIRDVWKNNSKKYRERKKTTQ